VVTAMDHHSNIVPWQILCQEKGATLRMVEITEGRTDRPVRLRQALEAKPKIVAFPYVSNSLGTVNPAAQLNRLAHGCGAVTVVDGAQSSPHLRVDVQAIDSDFYALSRPQDARSHGERGADRKAALLEAMPPYHGGGEMIERVWDDHSTWNKIPHKFEGGRRTWRPRWGWARPYAYLEQLGLDNVSAHEQELARLTIERLSQIEVSRSTDRVSIVPASCRSRTATFIRTTWRRSWDKDGVCICAPAITARSRSCAGSASRHGRASFLHL